MFRRRYWKSPEKKLAGHKCQLSTPFTSEVTCSGAFGLDVMASSFQIANVVGQGEAIYVECLGYVTPFDHAELAGSTAPDGASLEKEFMPGL